MNRNHKLHFSIMIILLFTVMALSACTAAQTNGTQRVSIANNEIQADQRSKQPSISADGRYVAFASDATNLVKGDFNGVTDIFVRDLAKRTTTRVSVSSDGTEGNKASYLAVHLLGWAICDLHIRGQQPGSIRYQWRGGCVRA